MRTRHIFMTAALIAAFGTNVATGAPTVFIGDVVNNGEFGTDGAPSLAGWTLGSTGASPNAQASTASINTLAGNSGFNSFFGSAFAVMGDDAGGIGGAPGAHPAATNTISQLIVLPEDIGNDATSSYDVVISFRTAFDGKGAGPGGPVDVFSGSLGGISLFAQNSSPFPDCGPSPTCVNAQLENNPFSASILGLAPGSYWLTFTLNESGDNLGTESPPLTNTAGGIDGVSILATATLAVPEPGTLGLLGLALAGLASGRRRRAS